MIKKIMVRNKITYAVTCILLITSLITIVFSESSALPELQIQSGHTDLVAAVCFSPDGKYLASGGYNDDATIKIWEINTGNLIRDIAAHEGGVTSLSFSMDGKHLASGGIDNTVKIWEVPSGKLIRTIEADNGPVYSVNYSPDSKRLITKGWKDEIRLWDVNTGKLVLTFKSSGHSGNFSPDGRYIASDKSDWLGEQHVWRHTIEVWDSKTGVLVKTFPGHKETIISVTFSPDGKYIASAGVDKTVKLWDFSTGELIQTFEGHTGIIWSIAFSPDGNYIASGSTDKTIKLWEVPTGKLVGNFSGHKSDVHSVNFSRNGKYIASGSQDSTVKLWEAVSGELLRTFERNVDLVETVSFTPDGKYLNAVTRAGSYYNNDFHPVINMWGMDSVELVFRIHDYKSQVLAPIISPDNKYAVIISTSDSTTELWDLTKGNLKHRIEPKKGQVSPVWFSPDAKYFVTTESERKTNIGELNDQIATPQKEAVSNSIEWDYKIKVNDLDTGKTIKTLKGSNQPIFSIYLSSDSKYLISEDMSMEIALWEVASEKLLYKHKQDAKYERRRERVNLVKFDPDNKYFILDTVYSEDALYNPPISSIHIINLFDVTKGKVLAIEEHNSIFGTVTVNFSLDSKHLAITNSIGTIKLIKSSTGEVIREISDKGVISACFSPDGKYLVSGNHDGTIAQWEIDTGKLIGRFQAHKKLVKSVCFSPDGMHLVSGSYDATVKFWDIATHQLVLTLMMTKDADWIVYSPDGYYNCSPGGARSVTFKVGDKMFPSEQYEKDYKNPDNIRKMLAKQNK